MVKLDGSCDFLRYILGYLLPIDADRFDRCEHYYKSMDLPLNFLKARIRTY